MVKLLCFYGIDSFFLCLYYSQVKNFFFLDYYSVASPAYHKNTAETFFILEITHLMLFVSHMFQHFLKRATCKQKKKRNKEKCFRVLSLA